MVTLTLLDALTKEPSFILAIATTSCVPARRMRVEALCEPASGPNLNSATPGVGLPMASTRIASAPGASTSIGTVLPFSAISGAVRVIPSLAMSAPPVNSEILSSAAALAGIGRPRAMTAPAPITITLRRVIVMLSVSRSEPPPSGWRRSVFQGGQIRHHVLDLLCGKDRVEILGRRLAGIGVPGAGEPIDLVEG